MPDVDRQENRHAIRCTECGAIVSGCARCLMRNKARQATEARLWMRSSAMTVIAMTREIGTLGKDVAAGLADKLGLRSSITNSSNTTLRSVCK